MDDATCKAIADEIVRTKQCPGIETDVAMNAVQQRHPGVLEDPERRKVRVGHVSIHCYVSLCS